MFLSLFSFTDKISTYNKVTYWLEMLTLKRKMQTRDSTAKYVLDTKLRVSINLQKKKFQMQQAKLHAQHLIKT